MPLMKSRQTRHAKNSGDSKLLKKNPFTYSILLIALNPALNVLDIESPAFEKSFRPVEVCREAIYSYCASRHIWDFLRVFRRSPLENNRKAERTVGNNSTKYKYLVYSEVTDKNMSLSEIWISLRMARKGGILLSS